MRFSFVLSRYFAILFLKWFLIFLCSVAVIIFIFDLTELIRRASSRSAIDVFLLVKLALLKLPSLLEKLLPFVTLFTGMFVFWRLNRYHELDITKSAGISIWGLLGPLAGTMFFVGTIDLSLINPLASKMMLSYEHLDDRYFQGNQGSLAVSESGLWVREQQDNLRTIYHFSYLAPNKQAFGSVRLFQSDSKDRFLRRLDAKSGQFKGKNLLLNQVWISAPDQLPYFLETYEVTSTYDFLSLQNAGADPQSLSFWELPTYMELLDKSGLSSLKYRLHWHSLMARLFWLVVMVLLGATFSMRPLRQGNILTWIITGAAGTFFLYFGNDVSYSMGVSGKLPAIMAAWAPVIASGLVGLTILLYAEDG